MAIKRFTGSAWYIRNGSRTQKDLVASAFGVPTPYVPAGLPNQMTKGFSQGWVAVNSRIGLFTDPMLQEYYFNTGTAIKLSEKISPSDMASQVISIISGDTSATWKTINSYDATSEIVLASQDQALWYATSDGISAPIVYFRCEFYHRYDQGHYIDLALNGGVRPGTWDAITGTWQVGQETNWIVAGMTGTVTPEELATVVNSFFNCYDHIYISPAKNITIDGAGYSNGYNNSPGGSGAMAYFNGVEPALFSGYNKMLWTGQFLPEGLITWTQVGGDVDPTDPGTEPDPYEPIPPGPEPPGPGPDPVDPVDPPPMPGYPPIGATSVGFFKAYKPNIQQLNDIASKLWDPTAWDAIKQMFTNPMDAIYGLGVVPVEPHAPTSEDVYLGRYNTHVSVPRIDRDFVTVDCGSLYIKKFFASYLDFDPYTKYSLYLPYIGEIDLNADEITAKTLSIKYHTNVITGDCVAFVLINDKVIYTGNGNMMRQIPLSQTDYTSIIQTVTQVAMGALAAGVAGAGAASIGSAIESASVAESGEMTGSGQIRLAGTVARQQSIGANLVSSTVGSVMGTKIGYKHAGRIGEGAGQISVQYPFITVIRPNLTLPEGHDSGPSSSLKRFTGYPVNKVGYLSEFHGLTIVEACQLNSQHATDGELAEALEIMKGGVIL